MNVLIVDDEKNIRDLVKKFLKLEDIQAEGAENGLSAQRVLREYHFDAVILDLKMPGMDGLTLLAWMRQEGFRMPVIMISAHGDISDAVQAMKEGAQDYIVKPFDPEELSMKLKQLIESQHMRNLVESRRRYDEADDLGELIGESPGMMKIKDVITRIAPTQAMVLITGESGTGKEVVARKIHTHSPQKEGPFIPINIGGVPEQLLESELFGYEKGAFTGAAARKSGMFELATGGTLFLDEIGDMPLNIQVKILRVLQDKRVARLGGTTAMPIEARIIAATNRNLEEEVRRGRFREDLFYRLNVVHLEIPPLRERREDIPLLAGGIIHRLNRSMGMKTEGISPQGIERLRIYSFPGNVRELENVLERAMIFSDRRILEPDDFELRGVTFSDTDQKSARETGRSLLDEGDGWSLKDVERETILRALHRWEGNRTRAAEELGISRRTLINKIMEYGIQ